MKFIQSLGLVLLLELSMHGYAVAQTDLNAPVIDRPTVASEIKRGIDAAFDCSLSASRPLQEEECAFKVQSDNEQKHSNHDAFDAGLFFQVWMDHETRLASDRSIASTNSVAAAYLADDERAARAIFPLMKSTEGKAALKDEQILSVLNIKAAAKNEVREQLQARAREASKGP